MSTTRAFVVGAWRAVHGVIKRVRKSEAVLQNDCNDLRSRPQVGALVKFDCDARTSVPY